RPVIKLKLRKCDCLFQLGRVEEAKEILGSIIESECKNEADHARWNHLCKLAKTTDVQTAKHQSKQSLECVTKSTINELTEKGLFRSHSKLSPLSAQLELCFAPSKGRHLVA